MSEVIRYNFGEVIPVKKMKGPILVRAKRIFIMSGKNGSVICVDFESENNFYKRECFNTSKWELDIPENKEYDIIDVHKSLIDLTKMLQKLTHELGNIITKS